MGATVISCASPVKLLSSPFLPFPIRCHLRREPGDLWGCRSWALHSSKSTKLISLGLLESFYWGLPQGTFVLTCQPLSEIYSQSYSPGSFPLWSWTESSVYGLLPVWKLPSFPEGVNFWNLQFIDLCPYSQTKTLEIILILYNCIIIQVSLNLIKAPSKNNLTIRGERKSGRELERIQNDADEVTQLPEKCRNAHTFGVKGSSSNCFSMISFSSSQMNFVQ